ncbi:MAG TPA: response regulator [Pyrinomonadaceae bacterium]|jgi:CheY-like chemotaxis protein
MFNTQHERIEQIKGALPARPQTNLSMPVILIVENDEDNRMMLKFLLEAWKYRVLEAADGTEALIIAEQERPDLILMDVKLPVLDGFDTTRQIRQSPKINAVPIVFLSGCAEANARQAAATAGGNEYLVKPINFQELEQMLGKYVRRR